MTTLLPRRAAPGRASRRLGRDQVRALLAAGTVLGLGAVGTLAAWTDSSTASSGTFTTGTIDIKLGSPAVDNNPPAFTTSLAASALKPGDTVNANLVVTNSGTLPFTYTFTGAATNTGATELGSALTLSVYAGSCGTGSPLNASGKLTFTATAARTLAAGATETLCFRAGLPSDAASTLQGLSTVGTFTFTATST